MPQPDIRPGIGSGGHAEPSDGAMMACSLAAKKLGISVAHPEAGFRSGDRGTLEEINRALKNFGMVLVVTRCPDFNAAG